MVKLDDATLRAAVFDITMESNEGFQQKKPLDVYEKWMAAKNLKDPKTLLNSEQQTKLNEWIVKWSQREDVCSE